MFRFKALFSGKPLPSDHSDRSKQGSIPGEEQAAESKVIKPAVCVSPSVASTVVRVELKGFHGKTNIRYMDINNRLMFEESKVICKLAKVSAFAGVSAWPDGTYFIIASDEQNQRSMQKFTVIH